MTRVEELGSSFLNLEAGSVVARCRDQVASGGSMQRFHRSMLGPSFHEAALLPFGSPVWPVPRGPQAAAVGRPGAVPARGGRGGEIPVNAAIVNGVRGRLARVLRPAEVELVEGRPVVPSGSIAALRGGIERSWVIRSGGRYHHVLTGPSPSGAADAETSQWLLPRIDRLKHQAKPALAREIVRSFRDSIRCFLDGVSLDMAAVVPPSDSSAGVFLLAAETADLLGVPFEPRLIRNSSLARQPQKRIFGIANRIANTVGSFALAFPVADRSVLVVDDNFSSGVTLEEIRALLYNHGAERVYSLAFGYFPFEETYSLTVARRISEAQLWRDERDNLFDRWHVEQTLDGTVERSMYSGVGIIFTDPDRRRFLVQQKERTYPHHPLGFCFFGGEVEPGESVFEAATRETAEELGEAAARFPAPPELVLDEVVVLRERRYRMTLFEAVCDTHWFDWLARCPVHEGLCSVVVDRETLSRLPFVWGLSSIVDRYLDGLASTTLDLAG